MPRRNAPGPQRRDILRILTIACFIGIAVGIAVYSTWSEGRSSETPPVEIVDASDIATRVAATASVPGRLPDGLTGSPRTASGRQALGICVQDLTGTLTDTKEVVSLVTDSIADLQANPLWTRMFATGHPPIVATSCPLPSGVLTSNRRDSRGRLHEASPPRAVATPFNIFVFVISQQIVERDFVGDRPSSRISTQEHLCSLGGDMCFEVSQAIHVTLDEFRDRSLRTSLFGRSLGFLPPQPPASLGNGGIWATPTSSPQPSPSPKP